MDRKVIKLEVAFGSERTSVLFKRNHDLTVRDIMDEIEKTYHIPLNEQSIYYKRINLCDYPNETLENLGVENNNQVRIHRETETSSNKSVKQQLTTPLPSQSQEQMYQPPPLQQQNFYTPRNELQPHYNRNSMDSNEGLPKYFV